MQIIRPLAAALSAAILLAAGPAAAQFAVGPLDEQGNGPVPPFYQPLLRQTPGAPADTGANGAAVPLNGGPLWLIVPRIDGQVEFTDNVTNAPSGGRIADVVTTISPGIYIGGDSPRLTANLDYSPTVQRFFAVPSQNNVTQNLFLNSIARMNPDDTLDLETSAAAFQSSHDGSFGGLSSSNLTTNDRVSTYAVQTSPVARTHFDSVGDAELRYILGETWFGGNTGVSGNGVTAPINDSTNQELRATLDSGDVGKYVTNRAELDGQQVDVGNSGVGSSKEALATDEVQLHLRQNFALLLSGGWQKLIFSSTPADNLNEPTWYGGFLYQPNPDSEIRATYGHFDGANSFQGDMHYSITPLTTVYADYSQTTTTPQQLLLSNLNNAVLGPNGTLVSSTTGLPFNLNNNEFALQNDIDRLRNYSASLVTNLATDSFTVTASHQDVISLTGLTPNDSATGGSVNWTRQLNELNSLSATASYYIHDTGHAGTFNAVATYNHQFGPSLFGAISFSFTNFDTYVANQSYFRNSLIFSLRKVF
jgi:uncharacterized protein (PEP-CTERM system associated)